MKTLDRILINCECHVCARITGHVLLWDGPMRAGEGYIRMKVRCGVKDCPEDGVVSFTDKEIWELSGGTDNANEAS